MTAQRVFLPTQAIRALRSRTLVTMQGDQLVVDHGAMDELARFLEATSRTLVPEGLVFGDARNDADISANGSSETLTISRKLVIVDPSDPSKSITIDPETVTITAREGGFMVTMGAKFGVDDDMFWFIGSNFDDLSAVTKTAALEYYANETGSAGSGGSGGSGSGAINRSATDNDAQVSDVVSVTHSNDGTTGGTTNGNDITVTMSYTLTRSGLSTTDPGSGSISADLILTRNYNGSGAASVATPTANGARGSALDPWTGLYAWGESISWSDTYTDSTGDLEDRVFTLELDALNSLTSEPSSSGSSILTLATSEPA